MSSGAHDVITANKFYHKSIKSFRVTRVRISGPPIDLGYRPYNGPALPCWLWSSYGYTYIPCNTLRGRVPRYLPTLTPYTVHPCATDDMASNNINSAAKRRRQLSVGARAVVYLKQPETDERSQCGS